MSLCPFCGVDPDEKIGGVEGPAYYARRGHECHCVHEMVDGKRGRVAWGICCARVSVGASLMLEEDYHRDAPWSKPEDCKCRNTMTLDEAIAHADEKGNALGEGAADHRQLAAWLRELQVLRSK